MPSHLGMGLVTPKALKNLNFSVYLLTWVPFCYTKSSQKFQLLRIAFHFDVRLVARKALGNLKFSGYCVAWVSILLQQRHLEISTFHGSLALSYQSRYTKELKNFNF